MPFAEPKAVALVAYALRGEPVWWLLISGEGLAWLGIANPRKFGVNFRPSAEAVIQGLLLEREVSPSGGLQ